MSPSQTPPRHIHSLLHPTRRPLLPPRLPWGKDQGFHSRLLSPGASGRSLAAAPEHASFWGPGAAPPYSVSPCLLPPLPLPLLSVQQISNTLVSPHLRSRQGRPAPGIAAAGRVLARRALLPAPPATASFASCRVKSLLSLFPASALSAPGPEK